MWTLFIIILLMCFLDRLRKIYGTDATHSSAPFPDTEETRRKKEELERRLKADAEYIERLHKEDEVMKAFYEEQKKRK